jgi:hypothetical protein
MRNPLYRAGLAQAVMQVLFQFSHSARQSQPLQSRSLNNHFLERDKPAGLFFMSERFT